MFADAAVDRLQRYESLQVALDLIDQGFTLMDQKLRLVACNRAFLSLLDFPEELGQVGTPFEAFIRINALRGEYGPGDPELQISERLARAARFERHEFERTRPDGRIVRVRGIPVPDIGFITLYSDVTSQRRAESQEREHAAELERRVAERTAELQLSERQMRLITDSIPALIAYFDHQKSYRYINRGYVEWFGLNPDQLETISAREYLGDTVYESVRHNVSRAFGGEAVSFEYEARCIDGQVRTARTTLIPEMSEVGAVVGCFELTFDVSELRRAQEQLAHAQKMEALGQLTGGIAHDFNNMLTVILGNLDALQARDIGGGAAAEFVEPAVSAARRGVELIRSLLGFARRQPLRAESADVSNLVDRAVMLLRRTVSESLQIEVDAAVGLHAWIDPNRLQDALVNLILNARDAGARWVKVSVKPDQMSGKLASELQASSGRYLRIAVTDNGHGMNDTTLRRVFEPFFTTKQPGAGTGLGLAMVYGFVRQSGGAIQVSSRVDVGTTFTIWLPVAVPEAAAANAAGGTSRTKLAEHTLALLVDDDPEVRRVVRRALIDLGFAVIEAENGAEALQLLDNTPQIELLLTDVVMPGEVDGRDVARRARSLKVPRVAMMSGYIADGPLDGVSDIPLLAKPFTARQLAEFLQRGASV